MREASVSRSLPPRMFRSPGVAGARTAATTPITAHTTRTAQRQRTSTRANFSINLSGSSGLRRGARWGAAGQMLGVPAGARQRRWWPGAPFAHKLKS